MSGGRSFYAPAFLKGMGVQIAQTKPLWIQDFPASRTRECLESRRRPEVYPAALLLARNAWYFPFPPLHLSLNHNHPRIHRRDRKSTRLNSSHGYISYAVFCLKKKNRNSIAPPSAVSSNDRIGATP